MIGGINLTGKDEDLGSGLTDEFLIGGGKKQNKMTLTPITKTKFTSVNKIDTMKVNNMKSLIDDRTAVVNMRCLVT